MSRYNRNQAPFYDDYDSKKQYTHLLAVPGRVAQAREVTQIQSVVKDIIKSVGDSLLKDGNIIEGCQIIVDTDKKGATVTEGKIYINGMVLPVKKTHVAIKGEGTEVIGVSLEETLITEVEDSSLRDPAQGYDNYNQPGCYRVKSELVVTTDNPDTILNTLVDGAIVVERYAPEYDTLTQTLARRTYDESGSYIVEGLNVRTESYDSEKYNIVIESGKAYVLGYELKLPSARRLRANKSQNYSPVTTRRTYSTSTTDYQLYNAPYVRDIISVTGTKRVTENQSISTNVDRRQLSNTNVLRLVSVKMGGTSYEIGGSASDGDCYLEQQGTTYYVKWNGTENYPTQTYEVIYEYEKVYEAEKDYKLVQIGSGHYIKWVGDTPENDTIFITQFNQYLARKDIVYIDRYGSIASIEGVPAEYNHEVAPEAPLNTLTLAIISNPPNGSPVATSSSEKIQVSNIGLTRFTMNDIQNILNRLNTMEYDQAVLSLNDEARNDVTANKKGLFTDPLIDISRIDFFFNKSSGGEVLDASKPVYDMALDLSTNIAYLPVITHTSDLNYSGSSTTELHSKIITLNSIGENVVLSQLNATKSFLINPYSMFPQMPEVSVTPSVDNWIDDTIIEVPKSLSTTEVVSLNTRVIDNSNKYTGWLSTQYRTRETQTVSDTAIGTKITSYSNESVISENSITYIRQRQLTVEGYNFPSSLDNIKGYFDGVEVPLTPADPKYQGTLSGSVKSDDNGYLKATFMIPSNVLTGTREVKLKSDIVREGYYSEGFTLYIAQGTSRTIQRTVTTLTTVLLQRTTTTTLSSVYVDPVGQTFVLDRMTVLKGIDLYFESKPSVNTPVVCEIREVLNGNITSQVYAHASLNPSQVSVSTDGSKATRFNFEDPVLLQENTEYAFVIRSTSDAYTLWVAELGENDIVSGSPVLKNTYMSGVMLSSSNNSTWTAHQTTDVKFRLIEDVYAMSSIAQFEQLSIEEFSRIYLAVDSAIPESTSIAWSYSTDGVNYSSITPYNIIIMNTLQDKISVRATLNRGEKVNITPMISLDSIALITSCYDISNEHSAYISKNITNLEAYSNIKIIADVYEPAGTSLEFKFSKNDGSTIENTTKNNSYTELNYGWKECTYTATVTGSPTQCRFFVLAKSDNKATTPAFRRLRVILS